MDVVIRHFPGHDWIRLFTGGRGIEPGHAWLYQGIVRRDAWRIGPAGFGVMRMPKASRERS